MASLDLAIDVTEIRASMLLRAIVAGFQLFIEIGLISRPALGNLTRILNGFTLMLPDPSAHSLVCLPGLACLSDLTCLPSWPLDRESPGALEFPSLFWEALGAMEDTGS